MPQANIRNLKLKPEVIAAVREGNFNISPIHSLDEALSLLTDLDFGALQKDGTYPQGTFNQVVDAQLLKYREVLKPENKDSAD